MSDVEGARAGLFSQARYVDRPGSLFTSRVDAFEEAVRAEERAARASLEAAEFRCETMCMLAQGGTDCRCSELDHLLALADASTPAEGEQG